MKKWLYIIHGWLGLNFGLVLFVICLSGSIAVLSHEIDWLCNAALRVTPAETRADWTLMTEAVREAYPDARIQYANVPPGSRFAVEFLIESPADITERVYVDPYRGTVTGRAPWFNTRRFFRDFHRRFFWYSSWGILLVAAFAYVLLLSAATGLLFYKRWWAKLFVLRVSRGLRIFTSDLHRLAGVWTLLFALLIGITGVWYSVEGPVNRAFRERSVRSEKSRRTEIEPPASDARRLPPEQWVQIAREAIPGLQVRSVWFPSKPDAPVQVQGQATAWLVRDRANHVKLDPYTGRVLSVQRAEDLGAIARWTDTADPLHFGTFGGLPIKLIWFAFGLALSALMPTGAYLWVRRREQMASGIAQRLERADKAPADIALAMRSETRRRTALGLCSTVAIWLLATWTTWEALSEQLADAGPTYGWRALGAPAVMAAYGSFVLLTMVATILWFRWIWCPPLPATSSAESPTAPQADLPHRPDDTQRQGATRTPASQELEGTTFYGPATDRKAATSQN